MGKYKLPFEYMPEYSLVDYTRYGENYWYIQSIMEDDNYFLLTSRNRALESYDEKFKLLIYDKKNGSGFVVKNENGIMGITDDILGGPPIRILSETDDYYIGFIEGLELLDRIEHGNYSPVPAFKKQLSAINDNTNELIILCHKKRTKSPTSY